MIHILFLLYFFLSAISHLSAYAFFILLLLLLLLVLLVLRLRPPFGGELRGVTYISLLDVSSVTGVGGGDGSLYVCGTGGGRRDGSGVISDILPSSS